jgi:hypothetical protein
MKYLKNIALTITSLLLLLTIGGFILPSHTSVYRSIEINSDSSRVFNLLDNYQQFTQWSPWAKKDTETIYQYSGPDKGVGAKMTWVSNNSAVGTGSQVITSVVPNSMIDMTLTLKNQDQALASFILKKTNEGTLVTWGFRVDHGFNPARRYFGLFLDELIGSDYEKGLANMKALIESAS